jgi:hypothetical protein
MVNQLFGIIMLIDYLPSNYFLYSDWSDVCNCREQGCVQYIFTFWDVQLNGNGAVRGDQFKIGEGLSCGLGNAVSMSTAI